MKLRVKSGGDVHRLIAASGVVRGLVRGGADRMPAKWAAALAEPGGRRRLWRALSALADFAAGLADAAVEVEVEGAPPGWPAGIPGARAGRCP